MIHWKALAAAIDPPVREEDSNAVVATLEKLEAAFRLHQSAIPLDGLMWTGPEDLE